MPTAALQKTGNNLPNNKETIQLSVTIIMFAQSVLKNMGEITYFMLN